MPQHTKKTFGRQGPEEGLQHPPVEFGEEVRGLLRGELLPMRPGGRRGIEFFEAGSNEVPEAFAVEEADGDVVRELRI